MLRGRRDRYHRLGFVIAFTVAAIATPVQMGGRRRAGPVGLQQPAGQVRRDRAGARDQQRRPRDAARAPQRRRHGQRRHPDPRPGLVAVRPEHRQVARSSRAWTPSRPTQRPTIRRRSTSSTSPGTSWSAWARCCSCCRSGTAASWIFRRRMPDEPSGSCALAACAGVLAVVTMEAGWVVTEVGRQPWIVYNLHEGRGRRDRQHRASGSRSSPSSCSTSPSASRRSSCSAA